MVAPHSHTFAVITGGGTSGHVVPAMAIAELLEEAGHPKSTLHYMGSDRGIETTMLPAFDMPFTLLSVDGFQRGLSAVKIRRNLMMIPTMVRAVRASKTLLRRLKPQVVISVGGYASIPACRAARTLGIPVVATSYDRRPGLATRLQSKYAQVCAIAYEPSNLRSAVLTGAPVRRAVRHADLQLLRPSARRKLGIELQARVVLVMGGSLGSTVLNKATEYLVKNLRSSEHTCVIHIAGERFMTAVDLPEVMHHENGTLSYQRFAYSHDMISLYAAADVVVCRAGASTIAEISTVGICSVIIPWKDAAENHQLTNAQWLSNHDAAVLLKEDDVTPHAFAAVVTELLRDDQRRAKIAEKAREMGKVHRESSLALVIDQVAKEAHG